MPKKETVNAFIEERRQEVYRLMEGAVRHLGADRYDISVLKRKSIDVYDPDVALFAVKVDAEPEMGDEGAAFLVKNLEDRGYTVKRLINRGTRLLMLV